MATNKATTFQRDVKLKEGMPLWRFIDRVKETLGFMGRPNFEHSTEVLPDGKVRVTVEFPQPEPRVEKNLEEVFEQNFFPFD